MEGEELVGCRQGTNIRILAKRSSTVSYEYTNSPVALLVPRLNGNEFAISAFSIARIILNYKLDDFSNIIFSSQLLVAHTDLVNQKLIEIVGEIKANTAREMSESYSV